ncbi:type II toxin-antitoxin system HipA family toxin [Methylosinus sporium]|uniref:type II toxin-antitoxin system HipA family toxin n=1 Tax=Methylosinus sporium TaxID=428 RepID=UPI00383A9594
MARRPRPPLNVYLNNRLVGRLRRESSGAIDFRYDESWLDWEGAIPVSLSLPLREDRYIGAPVIAVFENLLPDNLDIRRRIAERSNAGGSDAYSLLAAIGRDCVGALQFVPENVEPTHAGQIDARPVSDDEVAAIIADLGRNPLGVGSDSEFRISLAGAQEKTALLFLDGRWHVPHGTTPTTHIIKPEIGLLPNGLDLSLSVENEYLCLRLAAAFGLPVTNAEMAEFAGKKALVVERFDRLWTKDQRLLRLPQEDCCQALSVPPSLKYQSDGGPGLVDIAGLLKGSDTPLDDLRLLLKAQIVFWLLGATDGHAKNFSLRLAAAGRFRLAPLYDIMSTQPNLDASEIDRKQMRMAMSVGKNRHYIVDTIVGRHFEQTAALCGFPVQELALIMAELTETASSTIEVTLSRLPANFPESLAASIVAGATNRLKSLHASGDE